MKRRSDCGTSCLTPDQVEWAYRKWCAGYPVKEIARKLYVSPSTLYKSFKGRRRYRPPLEPPKE
jgi:hypothetical protein